MNTELLKTSIESALQRVLEDAAFVFTEPAAGPVADIAQEIIARAKLEVSGSFRGMFVLLAPVSLCEMLAREMTGDEDTDVTAGETLGELLNMTAGMTLEHALQGAGEWTLGVPIVDSVDAEDLTAGIPADVVVRLMTEEESPIEAWIYIDAGGDR
jgi:chemotaxis protein CheY-P-specific phosphatase CheC